MTDPFGKKIEVEVVIMNELRDPEILSVLKQHRI